jgi:hypothetical protein
LIGLLLAGCDATISAPPKPPPPVDPCVDLPAMTAAVVPDLIRVNGAASVSASGGSGRYTFALTNPTPVGALSGTRYVAGLTIGTDAITASDDCGNFAVVGIQVEAAFEVLPTRATVPPLSTFKVRVSGLRGSPVFSAQAGSGGAIAADGRYTAGSAAGTDIILVRDSLTGDQAAVVVTVSPSARFRPSSARLALPSGTFSPLETLDGTGVVQWTIKSGPGTIEQRNGEPVYVAPASGAETV